MAAMHTADPLEEGRRAFERQAWTDAHTLLLSADRESGIEPADLMRLAMAAYLIGRDEESVEILTRAHQGSTSGNDIAHAARCAFWIGFQLMGRGDAAQAGGWFARGGRLLAENELDCVEQGYLLIPVALQNLYGGEFQTSLETFEQVAALGARFEDPDLKTLGRLGRGQALIGMGRTDEGVGMLDEVMVAVTTGDVSAIIRGLAYCAVIGACQEVFDLGRAKEWTEALTNWCASQPDLVPYRGQCLVHRAQLMLLQGEWADAKHEAERARDTLAQAPDQGSIGMAFYELGELHRLRGLFAEAEVAYREASRWGHAPEPGLAKLRLAQGQIAAAEAASRRVVDEARDLITRSKILPAHVEIMLACNDVPAARVAADELSKIADEVGAPLLRAIAAHAQGAVLLGEGHERAALTSLRQAWSTWQQLEAPYEAARARVLIGLACRALGDEDGAGMELDAARLVFEQLGAAPDGDRVEALAGGAATPAGLTGREVEVLGLVATGKTNRQIADDLVISEKTVARHLSNIFTKLGVTSRAGATAYAYQHDLV